MATVFKSEADFKAAIVSLASEMSDRALEEYQRQGGRLTEAAVTFIAKRCLDAASEIVTESQRAA